MSKTLALILGGGVVVLGLLVYLFVIDDGTPSDPEKPDEDPDRNGPADPNGGREVPAPAELPPGVPVEEVARDVVREFADAARGMGELTPGVWEALVASEEGVRALSDLLSAQGDVNHRAAAVMLLGMSPVPAAAETLKSAVRGDFGADLRTAAIFAIAEGDPDQAAAALESAARDEDRFVAGTAIWAVLTRAPPEAAGVLRNVLDLSADPERRRMIYEIIAGGMPEPPPEEPELVAHLRGGPHPPPLEPGEDTDRLLELAVGERDHGVAMAAARAIAGIPGEKSQKAFSRMWESAEEPLKTDLLGVLGAPAMREVNLEFIRGAADLEKAEHRRGLANGLGAVDDPSVLPDLRRWLAVEKDLDVRNQIEETIRRLE